jgi:hypothetical protein
MQLQPRSIATPAHSYFCRIPSPRVNARITPSHDAAEAIPLEPNRIYDPNSLLNFFGFSEYPPSTHVSLAEIAAPVALVDTRAALRTSLKDLNRSLVTLYTYGIQLMRETIAAKLGSPAYELQSHEILKIASSTLYNLIEYPRIWIIIANAPIFGTAILKKDESLFLQDINHLLKKTEPPRPPDLGVPQNQNFMGP